MFCGRCKRHQNESQDVEVEDESSSNPQQSVDIIKEIKGGEAGVQDNSPSPDLTVSSATWTEKRKKKYWWCHLFRYCNNKEKSGSSADMHKESEISHPSVTTNSFSESHKTSDDETSEIDSNLESMEIDLNVESMEIDSNLQSVEIDLNVESMEIDLNVESMEIDSIVESMEIDTNVNSMEINSNIEFTKIDTNVESVEIKTNIKSTEIDSNIKSMEINSNVDSSDIDSKVDSADIDSNAYSTEIDSNIDSMEIDLNIGTMESNSNVKSMGIDSNVDSMEIDTNVWKMEIDSNIDSTETDTNVESMEINTNIKSVENDSNVDCPEIDTIVKSSENDSNVESMEIDNVESTEIFYNVESTNVQSTQVYSNVETRKPDLSFMTNYAKLYLKSQNIVYIKDVLPPDALKYRPYAQICHNVSKQAKSESVYGNVAASRETLSTEKLVCLGLPNLAQTCYMNSTLQGLLTLTHFMQEVHNQHTVWNFHPKSELIRLLENVELCHSSTNWMEKKCILFAFKKSIAELNSQFADDSQKDAYEFLSCVLTKMRSLSVDLHQSAVDLGMTYTCPVNAHMAFQMLSTRTCMGCGMQSKSIKDYVNLSLDLAYRGSVSQFLQSYLKKNQLEDCCKSCRAQESSQQWSFVSLPNVLIIQLQRFRSDKSNNLRKLDICVEITRELMLNSDSNTTEQTRYSLVSIISHLGPSAGSGHFICDSAYTQQESGDITECWLTYNDNIIKESTAKLICQLRQKTAYVLFYEKQQ